MKQIIEYHPEFSLLPQTAERARQLCQMYYFTGKRCLKNHLSLRFTSSGNCVECIYEKRNYIKANIRCGKKVRNDQDQKLAIEANEKGLSIYESSKPCKKGHYLKYVTTNNCYECDIEIREKTKEKRKWKRIEKIYKIKKEKYFEMLYSQKNKCKICECYLHEKNIHIDHCHKTEKVRSILCSKCNQAIGLLGEDYEKIQKAAEYILNSRKGNENVFIETVSNRCR